MPEDIDVEAFIEKMQQREIVHKEEEYDLTEYLNFKRFANLDEHHDYWFEIKICKIILNDIKTRSYYLEKLNRYCEGVKDLNFSDVRKIRYDSEGESYIIFTDNGQHEIYEDDLRFVYPTIVDVPDAAEYEVALENGGVLVYNKFTDSPAMRVYEREDGFKL